MVASIDSVPGLYLPTLGLDSLKEVAGDNLQYTNLIDKIKAFFQAELKKQPKFLTECFQCEVLFLFKESAEKLTLEPLKLDPFKKILNYYKPLMKPKAYTKQQHWLQQCYEAQALLPSPQVKQQKADSSVVTTPLAASKQNASIWQGSIGRWEKFIWENAGKLITLGLAALVAVGQASEAGTTNKILMPNGNLTDKFPFLPALRNQTLAMVNKPILALKVTANLTRSSAGENDIAKTERNPVDLKNEQYATSLTEKLQSVNLVSHT